MGEAALRAEHDRVEGGALAGDGGHQGQAGGRVQPLDVHAVEVEGGRRAWTSRAWVGTPIRRFEHMFRIGVWSDISTPSGDQEFSADLAVGCLMPVATTGAA